MPFSGMSFSACLGKKYILHLIWVIFNMEPQGKLCIWNVELHFQSVAKKKKNRKQQQQKPHTGFSKQDTSTIIENKQFAIQFYWGGGSKVRCELYKILCSWFECENISICKGGKNKINKGV